MAAGPSSNANGSVRSRLQALTKDELKDILKVSNMAGAGINKHLKDGK
jgi:hypothetical protein